MADTLCKGVTVAEVEAAEAQGWREAAFRLNGPDGEFVAHGFYKNGLHLRQEEIDPPRWVLCTKNFAFTRFHGAPLHCIAIADRIQALADWEAIDKAAQAGEPVSPELAQQVKSAIESRAA